MDGLGKAYFYEGPDWENILLERLIEDNIISLIEPYCNSSFNITKTKTKLDFTVLKIL